MVLVNRLRYSPLPICFSHENKEKYTERWGTKVQYHEVKLNLELNDLRNCYWAGSTTDGGVTWTTDLSAVVPGSLNSCSLFVDYIYLDTDERRRFAQVSHEYLEIRVEKQPGCVKRDKHVHKQVSGLYIMPQLLVVCFTNRNTVKLLGTPKAYTTKVPREILHWLRDTSDMVKMYQDTWLCSHTWAISSLVAYHKQKVQRLNDGAGYDYPVRYSLAPGASPTNRTKVRV